MTIYRGLNFIEESEYNKFFNSIKTGIYTDKSISSWTPIKSVAKAFASTSPTYMEFMDTKQASVIDLARKQGEKVIGYRGIILKTTIKPGVGIDLTEYEKSAESEVILPPGSYKIEYEEVLTYKDQLVNQTINELLTSIKKSDKEEFQNASNYLFKNFSPNDISNDIKDRLYNEFMNSSFFYKVKVNEDYFTNKKSLEVFISLPDPKLLKWFNPSKVSKLEIKSKKALKDLLKEIKSKFTDDIEKVNWNRSVSWWINKLGLNKEYSDALSKSIDKYNNLSSRETLNKINKLPSRERQKAIKDYMNQLKDSLSSISGG